MRCPVMRSLITKTEGVIVLRMVGHVQNTSSSIILQLSFSDQDEVVRGCWNTVSSANKALCEAEDNTDDRCHKCFGSGCNTHDHSAAVSNLVALPLVFITFLMTVLMK